MEWTPAAGIVNGEAEIAGANYPDIRFFKAVKLTAKDPQINMPGSWETCTPLTMKNFSAISYFFAQRLNTELTGVPIGIINCSWGGTPAEVWIAESDVANDKTVAEAAVKLTNTQWGPNQPGRAYNAMINPLAGFKVAGVLWYQGESNVGSHVYDKTLSTLIETWRAAWQDNFPFYYVQITPFNYEGNTTQGVTIRNAQRKVLQQVTKTDMVVVSDISPVNDIHPRDKKPVGVRLANLALKNIYGIDKGVVNSPLYKNFKLNGSKLTVYFENATGLHFTNKTSHLFEIAGTDGVYHIAKAKIENDAVVLTSKEVAKPTQVRFAWHNTAQANLFNGADLPASSFISE